MRVVAWMITVINLLFGLNAFLNAVGILRSSKYARGATWFVAILFLGIASYSIYELVNGSSAKQSLWLSLAPWLIAGVVMFLTLAMNNWQ